jgi:hypothetical protein
VDFTVNVQAKQHGESYGCYDKGPVPLEERHGNQGVPALDRPLASSWGL